MANVIKLRKGLDIKLKGQANKEYLTVSPPQTHALCPEDFTGITPKVVVKEQEYVKAGNALFVDKFNPELAVVSPVSGVVKSVERGAKRKVTHVVVETAQEQEYADFDIAQLSELSAEQIRAILLKTGLFAFIRQRPYDIIADPKSSPKSIFVSAFDTNPLAPDFEFVLQGQEADFETGLRALSKMAKTYLGVRAGQTATALLHAEGVEVNVFSGPHPAGNVGVQINHLDPVNKGETVWTIDPQAVIFIGRLFNKGIVDLTRTVALTGSEVTRSGYIRLKPGALLTDVLTDRVAKDRSLRYISGNVLTGKRIEADGYLGAFHNHITVIPAGDNTHEMLGWIMPRFNHFSMSRSYFSWLGTKKDYVIDDRIKGGERHMIMSDEYTRVFPMDIIPEYLIKAIISGDIDKMETLGIYEVAPEDFALCEFVCSSKMELQKIVRSGLDSLRAEMA